MNEIYWITRLDGVCTFLTIVAICAAATGLYYAIGLNMDAFEYEPEKENKVKQFAIICWIVFFLSIFINVFIPNTKQAYIIYGVGGTIEYIKSNDKAKELPDKCVDALDKLLDIYINESENKN